LASIADTLRTFLEREFVTATAQKDRIATASLIETGIIDSVGLMRLVDFIEKEFHCRIGDDELLPENFEYLDRLVAFVATKKG
jgi:acyl carrier protein